MNISYVVLIQEWKNAAHIVTAIHTLKQQYNNSEVNQHMVSV